MFGWFFKVATYYFRIRDDKNEIVLNVVDEGPHFLTYEHKLFNNNLEYVFKHLRYGYLIYIKVMKLNHMGNPQLVIQPG